MVDKVVPTTGALDRLADKARVHVVGLSAVVDRNNFMGLTACIAWDYGRCFKILARPKILAQ
jgi:hypothetical protein